MLTFYKVKFWSFSIHYLPDFLPLVLMILMCFYFNILSFSWVFNITVNANNFKNVSHFVTKTSVRIIGVWEWIMNNCLGQGGDNILL